MTYDQQQALSNLRQCLETPGSEPGYHLSTLAVAFGGSSWAVTEHQAAGRHDLATLYVLLLLIQHHAP